jgi:hypothetical protein
MEKTNSNTDECKTNFETNIIKEKVYEITLLIDEMKKNGKTDSFDFELDIMTKHPDFYQSHPFLVKKLCKGDDISILFKMLDSLDKVEQGDCSLSSVEFSLGKDLANKYVYPNIEK